MTTLRALLQDRSGATAIEYGMIAACVAILLISSLETIGTAVEDMFMKVDAGFTATP